MPANFSLPFVTKISSPKPSSELRHKVLRINDESVLESAPVWAMCFKMGGAGAVGEEGGLLANAPGIVALTCMLRTGD